jgi:hypothetical protein
MQLSNHYLAKNDQLYTELVNNVPYEAWPAIFDHVFNENRRIDPAARHYTLRLCQLGLLAMMANFEELHANPEPETPY